MREHLRAGTREIVTGRAHHSDKFEGYKGEPAWHMHGMRYFVQKEGEIIEEVHGISDGLTDDPDHKAILKRQRAARKSLVRSGRDNFQKLPQEYLRPPNGY